MSKKTVGPNNGNFQAYCPPDSGGNFTAKCHETHDVLKIGGGEILGASCRYPRKGFDIYVGFDYEMAPHYLAYPWVAPEKRVELIHFTIRDMEPPAPEKQQDFFKLVDYLCNQLQGGKKIHMGCIGGHGRTGTVLAAIVAKLGIDKDAIEWVRQNHCKRAVESQKQIDFLVKHFGCLPAAPTKEEHQAYVKGKKFSFDKSGTLQLAASNTTSGEKTFSPASSKKNIWDS